MTSIERVPVICRTIKYWYAFRDRYLRKDGTFVGRYTVERKGKRYFLVLENDPHRLYGLNLKQAIIYCCFPDDRFMEVLESQFREGESNIDVVWDGEVDYEICF